MEGIRTYPKDIDKIDDLAVDGLSGVSNSLAYKVHEIEKHFHNSEQIWGLTSNILARKATTPVVVTGGAAAWGTELMLTDGTVIESGSATEKFDFNHLYLVAVGTANRPTILEFYYSPIGTGVACTFDETGGAAEDIVLSTGHLLENGDKIVLKAGAGALPGGVNDYTVYYVVGKAADYFQVALTVGGSPVEFSGDGGACFWYPINTATGVQTNTQTLMTETLISVAATNADANPQEIKSPRVACNYRLFCRAWADTGANAISFFLGLHIYTA
jgi:hypothetical protein